MRELIRENAKLGIYLSGSVVLGGQQHLIVDSIVNPLRLDIFSVGEDLDELGVSISDDVGDSFIRDVDGVSVVQDLTTEGEDDEFKGVSGDFSVAEEDQAFEEVGVSIVVFTIHLLNSFILVEFIRDSVFFILDVGFNGVFLVFDEKGVVAEGVEVGFQFNVNLRWVL